MTRAIGVRFPLSELDARFLRFERVANVPGSWVDGIQSHAPHRDQYHRVDSLVVAHGITFLCPKCYHANKGSEGTHRVTCWFEGAVPDDVNPGPGRWTPAGNGIADLTFVPGETRKATSVQLRGGCNWHGHIIGGCATVLPA